MLVQDFRCKSPTFRVVLKQRRANDTRDSSRFRLNFSDGQNSLYFSAASVISRLLLAAPCITRSQIAIDRRYWLTSVNVSRRPIATSVLPSRRHKSAMAKVPFEPFVLVVQLCSAVFRRFKLRAILAYREPGCRFYQSKCQSIKMSRPCAFLSSSSASDCPCCKVNRTMPYAGFSTSGNAFRSVECLELSRILPNLVCLFGEKDQLCSLKC